jgi:aldose 1-epimerase
VAVIPPSGEQVEIAFGDQHATIVGVGAGLRTYSAGGRDVLDGYAADEPSRSGRGQVLIPWPNRLEDGAYEFDGHRHQLPLTEPELGNAIHGLVRWETWTVVERERSRVVLEHVLQPKPGFPFTLSLAIEYGLSERGLSVRTTATNSGRNACPFGSGQHPYLTVGTPTVDSVVLRAPGRTVLRENERHLPVGREPVAGTEYDFRRPRSIGDTRLDDAFTDLERDAEGLALVELRNPEGGGLTLWADESYGYLQLFTGDPLPDVSRRSLAVEPMTCPPNAFRTGEALVRLEPGDTHTSRWGIAPSISSSSDL